MTARQSNAPRPRAPKGKANDMVAGTVAQLVTAIEAGASGPWQMPWQRLSPDILNPTNAATGKPYATGR